MITRTFTISFDGQLTNGPLSVSAFLYTLLIICSCCTIFILHFFPCCTLFIFHFFQYTLFSCWALFMLHSVHVEFFSCCTLLVLHFLHVAPFLCCTFSVSHLFFHFRYIYHFSCFPMLHSFHVVLFFMSC